MSLVKKQAVHFGAGNIGRGFLGQLYWESGFCTTFVDVDPVVIEALQQRRSYTVHIADVPPRQLIIEDVDALYGGEERAVVEKLACADIVSTAVGVHALPHIVAVLAQGIEARSRQAQVAPLNVILCENMIGVAAFLRGKLREALPVAVHPFLERHVGLVEASIGRMVPVVPRAQREKDPLYVLAEPYCALPVDAQAFKGPVPAIAHMQARPNFEAYVARKLFVHNMSHATAAYLGYLRRYTYIWQAVGDEAIRREVGGAMEESCRALTCRYGLDADELAEHCGDLLQRYANRALGDQVQRVARDPLRKLGKDDRLIGAARLCLEQGISPKHIAFAVAAAIDYDDKDDPAAQSLQRIRRDQGLDGVFCQVCEIDPNAALAQLIMQQQQLMNESRLG